ncbi:MAG: DUF2892 domain-containing protein [Flavobacteriaceae bacterium]|nr:DUF2892 domain-containing protein [Flavobacteriaceae bacterium]
MFHKNIKLGLAAATIGWAAFEFYQIHIGNGISILLLSSIFVFFYFKNEFLLLAFMKLRKQDFKGSNKWLSYIKKPESALIQKQQGYFYYLQGLMLSQTNMTKSEKLFKKALELGLSMKHDLAMAKLNLAGIALSKRRKREATMYLTEAKKDDKYGMLKEQIAMMKKQMKKI